MIDDIDDNTNELDEFISKIQPGSSEIEVADNVSSPSEIFHRIIGMLFAMGDVLPLSRHISIFLPVKIVILGGMSHLNYAIIPFIVLPKFSRCVSFGFHTIVKFITITESDVLGFLLRSCIMRSIYVEHFFSLILLLQHIYLFLGCI